MVRSSLVRSCVFLMILAGCGPAGGSGTGGGDGGPHDSCAGNATRCSGDIYQECQDGHFADVMSCQTPQVCSSTAGCVDCDPSLVTTCVGNEVHTCNSDGTIGDTTQTCGFEGCSNGSCGGQSMCAGGQRAELIYVVDEKNELLSFNPAMDKNEFKLIGTLKCSAASSLPGWGNPGPATPFSMSVDRDAVAWVLYTSGEIFHVSTVDASCTPTSFQVAQKGFELFGMGFVSDTAGSDQEHLYIAGGKAGQTQPATLGIIDPSSLQVTSIGKLPSTENGPELTGTGDAKLYGYYPASVTDTIIAEIDKAAATNGQNWSMGTLGNAVTAWAFAQWGGRFYVFVTTTDFLGNTQSNVMRLDPKSGQVDTILTDIPYVIVGAGVSTCAPVVIN